MTRVLVSKGARNRTGTMDYRMPVMMGVQHVAIQSGRRWQRRLDKLAGLTTASEARASAWSVTRARQIMSRLDELGADTSGLRLYLTDEGLIEIQRRLGNRLLTAELGPDSMEFHDVDVDAGRAVTRHVGRWEAAAEALIRA